MITLNERINARGRVAVKRRNRLLLGDQPRVYDLARNLIREIERRDGEGNTIPDYLYRELKSLLKEKP